MHQFPANSSDSEHAAEEVLKRIARLISTRPVRPVVTPSGQRARGNFPTIKSPNGARFESLVERDLLRALEVAPSICKVDTHPFVLALPSMSGKVVFYTPDILAHGERTSALIEVKGAYFLTIPESLADLRVRISSLRAHGLKLVVIVEADVRKPGLQEELETLLRNRPAAGRYRPSLDARRWDPRGRTVADPDVARRWAEAGAECDALLARAMKRDPDDFIAATIR